MFLYFSTETLRKLNPISYWTSFLNLDPLEMKILNKNKVIQIEVCITPYKVSYIFAMVTSTSVLGIGTKSPCFFS